MSRFFSTEELAALERAVKEAEAGTSGQIVLVVAERSSRYAWRRAVATFVVVVTLSILLYLGVPGLDAGLILVGQVVAAPLLWLLLGLRPLLLALVPDDVEQAAVDTRARVAFVDHRVFDTREHAGVLVFLSLLERRVQVLVDSEVPPALAKRCAEVIVDGMRAGRAAEAVREAILDLGQELRRLFPSTSARGDGLADEVRVERRR